MLIKIAINGYGRIGRCLLRFIYENNLNDKFKIVFINDLCNANSIVHLTKYDTTHGIFNFDVTLSSDHNMIINEDNIKIFNERNIAQLPCNALGIDLILECTGIFTSKAKCLGHLQSGAKKILISAPNSDDVDATIVYGVNHEVLRNNMNVVSNASCTTNCLAPVIKVLHKNFGVKYGLMTTIHSYTNDQSIVDTYHTDLRRARAAAYNMIPTKTGAADIVGTILPELKGKLDGFAIRVPTINVSVLDLTCTLSTVVSNTAINNSIKRASENELKGILQYNEELLVSTDFNHNIHASIFDSTQTRIIGNLIKVLSWYDNEWGFANQMLNTASFWTKL